MDDPVTVLAVDDQSVNLRLLDAVLTPRGHRVLTASSGAEALALLETEDVDLVLSDVVMPEMDGYEVCRRIRSNPSTEFLPVVMITASGSEQRLNALHGRRRRLHHQALRPERTAGPGGVPGAYQALSRHNPAAGSRVGRMEHRTRVSGRCAGRRAGAGKPATPFPVTAIGRSGHRRRAPPRKPSPRNRGALRRSAGTSPRSPRPASPRR